MKRTAVSVPEYNEQSRSNLEERPDYFNYLATTHANLLDVIIVDDASTDGSREAVEEYVRNNNPAFKAIYRETNGQKVWAIRDGVNVADPNLDTILLTDFDSSIPDSSIPVFDEMLDKLHSDGNLGGLALRVDVEDKQSWLGYVHHLRYMNLL